jgi:hypothetical protein
MDEVDIQAFNSGSFVLVRSIAGWATLYPLADCTFRGYMRTAVGDAVVLYQWSTDIGNLQFIETLAFGSFVFGSNPVNGDVIVIGDTIIEFVSGTPTADNVVIGEILPITMGNLLAFLQSSPANDDVWLSKCTFSVSDNELDIIYNTTDLAGNQFSIAVLIGSATPSGPTLTGAGGALVLTAAISDIKNFLGTFIYDVRMEYAGIVVYLFGGSILFSEASTR